MAKLSGITTPSLTFDEGSAPSTPSSNDVVLYAKSDGLLYSKDDAGTETLVSGGVGGGSGEFTEIDVVSKTDNFFGTTSATFTDVTGLSITQTTAAVRCMVVFSGVVNCSQANVPVCVDLDIDGTRVGNTTNGLAFATMQSANDRTPLSFTIFSPVLSAASHTFKIQLRSNGTATAALQAETTTSPAIFQVIETSLAS